MSDAMARLERVEMLLGVSELTITGRVGREPEMRYFQSGKCKVQLEVAVNKLGEKPQEGEKTKADWFRVEIWNDDAQAVVDQVAKGDVVRVTGRYQLDQWTGRDGEPMKTNMIRNVSAWSKVSTNKPQQAQPARQPAAAAPAQQWQSRQPAAADPFGEQEVPF